MGESADLDELVQDNSPEDHRVVVLDSVRLTVHIVTQMKPPSKIYSNLFDQDLSHLFDGGCLTLSPPITV